MVNVNDVYPSNYLKAADLKKREVAVTIDRVVMEDLGGDHKPVAYFAGKEKGVVLNKTNSTNIASAYGPETDMWIGKSVILYPAWVDFQGKSMEAIRIRPNTNGGNPVAQNEAPQDDGPQDDGPPF